MTNFDDTLGNGLQVFLNMGLPENLFNKQILPFLINGGSKIIPSSNKRYNVSYLKANEIRLLINTCPVVSNAPLKWYLQEILPYLNSYSILL